MSGSNIPLDPPPIRYRNILVIGAGPIVIGQACEFDYSGSQACRVLKQIGFRVVLINSNPATIMTDPELADRTYIEPIRPEVIERIIEREQIEAVLPTLGGQTALNCAVELEEKGILSRHGCKLIGISLDAIRRAEDRQLFNEMVEQMGLRTPRNRVVRNLKEAFEALEQVGLPAIIRPSFTLGGSGGGVAYNHEEFESIVRNGLATSPVHTIQIDESLLGWKEYELEVVRDRADNCVVVCAIENVDPMGVHTGDSITVAPALTLTDKEYQRMRNAAFEILKGVGVETGGSNVQFALNPENGDLRVIEMNPRVSRSSALASKATGFPIAKAAALLAVGYTLDQIPNACTQGVTPISFEPTLDYVICKIPRFNFEKFPESPRQLGSSMKAVGEVMGIGRNFLESLQKAYQSLEEDHLSLSETSIGQGGEEIENTLSRLLPERLLNIVQAIRQGIPLQQIHEITRYDLWYLEQFETLVRSETDVRENGLPRSTEKLLELVQQGFSQKRLAELTGKPFSEVREIFQRAGLRRVYKCVDTCAAEFASRTPYFYSTWEASFSTLENLETAGTADTALRPPASSEAAPSPKEKIMILGSGPNRIGQGIEFDYVCVQGVFGLQSLGYEVIIVNCNPETVSTDYDIADRLYFEPIELEFVLDIIETENRDGLFKGVIVQYGGQTPLKLAAALSQFGVPLLGSQLEMIQLTEDRQRFSQLLSRLQIQQPPNGIAYTPEEALEIADRVGYPVLARPSFVLGGAKMRILHDRKTLREHLEQASIDYQLGPLLIDRYLEFATELDVDAISDGKEVYIAGIMEHIEEAGIHSGDSACVLPPFSIGEPVLKRIREIVLQLSLELKVQGLINVQLALKEEEIFLLEVNPRASRTTPFVSKATGVPIARIGAQVMAGKTLAQTLSPPSPSPHYAVKEVVLPFRRFPEATTLLGPEMKSTGEVMGISRNFEEAFCKAYLAGEQLLPKNGGLVLFVLEIKRNLDTWIQLAQQLRRIGFQIGLLASPQVREIFDAEKTPYVSVPHVQANRPNVLDMLIDQKIVLVLNQIGHQNPQNEYRQIRSLAIKHNIPYSTTFNGALTLVQAISWYSQNELSPIALQDL